MFQGQPDGYLGLSLEARRETARVSRPKRVLRGASLYALGDRTDGVYLLREGLIWLEGPRSGEGEPATLGVVGPGGLFGEEALVGERRRTSGATALSYAELLLASSYPFLQFRSLNPARIAPI